MQLELRLAIIPTPAPRTYATLSALEHDAFNARIWCGLNCCLTMKDGYDIGHRTAARVLARLRYCHR